MSTEISKKFYRNVVRGVSFYSEEKKRACKLGELVAYVYLKNSRALPAGRVESIVKKALVDLCAAGLIEKTRDSYRLSEKFAVNRLTQRPTNEEILAGPSGSNKAKRRASPEAKRSTKSNKRSKTRGSPVDAEGIDGAPVAEEDNLQEEEEEGEDVDDSYEEEEFPDQPQNMEDEDSEDRHVPVAIASQTVVTPLSGENETEQGSSPTESSSALFAWLKFW